MPSPAVSSPAATGRARWWRAGQTAGAQAVAKVVSGLCQLAVVPLLLNHFGTETFGWLMALVALGGLVQFGDLGVQTALQHELAKAWAGGNPAEMRRLYAAGARVLLWLSAGWAVLGLPLAWAAGDRILKSTTGSHAFAAWAALVLTTCAAVRYSAGARLAAAVQAGWIPALWSAVANIVMIAAVAIAVRADGSPAVFLIILLGAQIVPAMIAGRQVARRLEWQQHDAEVDPELARRLWRDGLRYAPWNLAGALVHAATPVAFARFGGYEANAAFAILQRLFGPVAHAHSMATSPLWPAYTEAQARGDTKWARHAFRLSLWATLAGTGVVVVIAAGLPWITSAWLGSTGPAPAPSMAWLLAVWSSACMTAAALTYFLLGHGEMTQAATGFAIAQIATLVAMAAAGWHWGAIGVATALAGGVACIQVPVLARACFAVRHRGA